MALRCQTRRIGEKMAMSDNLVVPLTRVSTKMSQRIKISAYPSRLQDIADVRFVATASHD